MNSIMLPPAVEERLERLAKKTGQAKASYARQPVIALLDRIERRFSIESRRE